MKQHPTETIGNFDMGDWFGDVKCRHVHRTRLFDSCGGWRCPGR